MPNHSEPNTQRLGTGMLIVAAVLILGLFTLVFDRLIDQQANPNQTLTATVSGDGYREVTLGRNRGGHYVASGTINGSPVTFLLDTGATTVTVSADLAGRLGLPRGSEILTQTANGQIVTYATRLESVNLGGLQLRDVAATINPQMRGNDVLLGMSFLGQLEFNQRGDTLTLRQWMN